LGKYRVRSAVALALMIAQAFLFNAVFFSYGLVERSQVTATHTNQVS